MDLIRWIISVAFIFAFLWIAVANWSIVWIYCFTRKNVGSCIPMMGGLLGAIGMWILPIDGSHRIAWIPFLLDWGSIPHLVYTAGYFLVYWGYRRR